jgi:hypothetical membrane protein
VKLFLRRHPKVGPVLYLASIQFFPAQILVALQWSPSYNLGRDTISDLGNTSCEIWNAHFVCSPFHDLMNASLIVLGTCMILGSVFIASSLPSSRATATGFAGMAASGAGVIMAGAFPENTVPAFHGLGTAAAFLVGNTGLAILAFGLSGPVMLRGYSFASGALALIALAVYASGHYVGLGEGGMERVVAYPQVVWLAVAGLYFMVRASQSGNRAHVRTSEPPGGTGGLGAAAT